MNNALEVRVSKIEKLQNVLGQSNMTLTKNNMMLNEVFGELVSELSNEVRYQVKEEFVTRTAEMESNVISKVDGHIENKVRTAVNERGLNRSEMNKLTKARNYRFIQLLGSPQSDRYIVMISQYQSAMIKGYRKQFDCTAYGDVEATRFEEAMSYIENFSIDAKYVDWIVELMHKKYQDGEMTKRVINAYERFYGIVNIKSKADTLDDVPWDVD